MPLTPATLVELGGARLDARRLRGYAVMHEGVAVLAVGLAREWWWFRAFADARPGFDRSRVKVIALRAMRSLLARADRPVYARADPSVPRAPETLLWLGFEPLALGFYRLRRR